MNKAKQKAIKQLQRECNPIKDDDGFEYYATNNIVFAIDIAIKETIKDLFKYNSSFPVSDERVNFEKMIKEFQNTAFTEKLKEGENEHQNN